MAEGELNSRLRGKPVTQQLWTVNKATPRVRCHTPTYHHTW